MTKMFSFLCIPAVLFGLLLSIFTPLNHALFNAINQVMPSKIMWMTITNMGDAIFLGCVLFIALYKNPRLLINALVCALLIHYIVKFTKNFFAVLRPEHTFDVANVITLGPALDFDNYSMPSGHTASAFMAAIFVTCAYKLRGWKLGAILSYAFLVGISRIAVGAHWPADVCAGAAIGIIFGLLCTNEKLHLKHNGFYYLGLLLYAPFIYFAITHIKRIHGITTLVNEGIFVVAGIAALIMWLITIQRLFSKKTV